MIIFLGCLTRGFFYMEYLAFFIGLSFLYPFLNGVSTLIEARYANQYFKSPATILFFTRITSLLFLPLVLFFGMPTLPSSGMLICYVFVAGLDLLYLVPYYKSLDKIDTSIVTALLSLGKILIPIFTWLFLNEQLDLIQYVGFMLIILASLGLSIKNFKMPHINIAFFLMMLSGAIRSVYSVLEKFTINADGNWINMLIWPPIFSVLLLLCLMTFKKQRNDITKSVGLYREKFPTFIFLELLAFGANVVMFYVLPYISAVQKTSISATMPIFVLLTSIVVSKVWHVKLYESMTRADIVKKLILFAVMVWGVYWVL